MTTPYADNQLNSQAAISLEDFAEFVIDDVGHPALVVNDSKGDRVEIFSQVIESDTFWIGGALLTREMVAELIPVLQRFVDTGSISKEKEERK